MLTPRSGDHGRDITVGYSGVGTITIIDSCKAVGPKNRVRYDDVRALIGVVNASKVSKGILTTTGDFPKRWTSDPFIRQCVPNQLELVNGRMLIERLVKIARNNPTNRSVDTTQGFD